MRQIEFTEHGTYGFAMRERCDCKPCKDAVYRYRKGHRSDVARGIQRRVPVQPSREHLLKLLELGADFQKIRAASGGLLSRSQIRNIVNGTNHVSGKPQLTVHWKTENVILALAPERVLQGDDHSIQPATGARRRVNALEAIGFTKADIAEEWGVSTSRVYLVFKYPSIKSKTLRDLDEVYQRMAARQGTNELMRWRAIREGWPPPMAWDDDTIDDPATEPNFKAVACAVEECTRGVKARGLCDGHNRQVRYDLTPHNFRRRVMALKELGNSAKRSDLLADLRELKAQGLQLKEAAAKLGRSEGYVDRIWYAA